MNIYFHWSILFDLFYDIMSRCSQSAHQLTLCASIEQTCRLITCFPAFFESNNEAKFETRKSSHGKTQRNSNTKGSYDTNNANKCNIEALSVQKEEN